MRRILCRHWSQVRTMFLGGYANQSTFCAVGALLCGFLAPFGLWAGYRAYGNCPRNALKHRLASALSTG